MPGQGFVQLAKVGPRTSAVRVFASSSLKVLLPHAGRECAWIVTSTYGGGLVDGDSISLKIEAGAGTRCLLGTQASTKVYRSPKLGCRQSLDVKVGEGAIAIVAPDPTVCYAGSSYIQRQQFDLSADAGLVMIDWLSSGRWARGERWAFSRYENRSEVRVEGKTIFRDVLLLDPADGPVDGPMRMGRFDCLASVLVIGTALQANAERLVTFISEQAAPSQDAPMIFAASAVADGVVIRIAGPSAETVGRWIRQRLDFVPGIVGEDPWVRKW